MQGSLPQPINGYPAMAHGLAQLLGQGGRLLGELDGPGAVDGSRVELFEAIDHRPGGVRISLPDRDLGPQQQSFGKINSSSSPITGSPQLGVQDPRRLDVVTAGV